MRTALSLLAATAFLAPGLSQAQSSGESTIQVASSGIQESEGELSGDVRVHVDRGDQLVTQVRFAAAAREYRRAADVARREGHLPSWTTWKLANAYFNDDNLFAAAGALDQLANEAALVGDLRVEALAIFNSAWLYGQAGRRTETLARVTRLERLLRSPYMPIAIREHLLGRLGIMSEVVSR